MKKKKKQDISSLKVNPELEGLNITINSLGEIHSTFDIDRINIFLNNHVDDKKLKSQE